MLRRLLLLTVTALALAVTAAAADGKADSLLRKVREATEQAKTLEAEAVVSFTGKERGSFTVTMRLMKPNLAYLTITGAPGGERRVISDGKNLFQVAEETKRYQVSPTPDTGAQLGLVSHASPESLFFAPDRLPSGKDVRLLGKQKLGGREYQVLEVTSAEPPQTQKFYVGPTGLVEGLDAIVRGPEGDHAISVLLKNPRVGAALTAEQFEFKPGVEYRPVEAASETPGLLPQGTAAPDFRLERPEGGHVSLSDTLKGKKAVLLFFWYRECGACRDALPELKKLYADLRETGLEILAVNAGDTTETVRKYFQENGYEFPALMGGGRDSYAVGKAYGVRGYPTTYLLNGEGKVVMNVVGFPALSVRSVLQRMGVQ